MNAQQSFQSSLAQFLNNSHILLVSLCFLDNRTYHFQAEDEQEFIM